MPQGILPYEIELTGDGDGVTARAGLPLVIETMRALRLDRAIEQHLRVRERDSGYSDVEKVEALMLLLASGGECLDDIGVLQADTGLGRLLERTLPGTDVLRRFLYRFHDERLIEQAQRERPAGTVAYVPQENEALQGMGRVNVALVHALWAAGKSKRATLDHDATVIESHKAEAQAHYKGGVGYQPSVVYWAELDVALTDEFRDGNVPAGMGNLPLIRKAFAALPAGVTERFFRADSACYDERVMRWLADEQREGGGPSGFIGFSISADMSRELHALCEATAEPQWQLLEERADETVSWAEVEFAPGDWPKDAQPLRYVALRLRKKQGQLFASGYDTKYLAVVSNRRDLDGAALIRWHWEKAGTIEHLHQVTKNDLAAAVMPCGRFGANAAWYRLNLLAYNVLSAMKSLALPPTLSSARPKRLRFAVFHLAARISTHAGRLWARLSEAAQALAQLVGARMRLRALLPAVASG
jgi:hypothetical protein